MFARRRSSLSSMSCKNIASLTCLCLLVSIGHVSSMSLDRVGRQYQQQNDKQLEFSEFMLPEAESEVLQNDMELVPAIDGNSDMYLLVPAAAAGVPSASQEQQLQSLTESKESETAENNSDMLMLESEDTPAVQILELPDDVLETKVIENLVNNNELEQESESSNEDKEQQNTNDEEKISDNQLNTIAEAVQEIKHEIENELVESDEAVKAESSEASENVKEETESMSMADLPMEHKDTEIENLDTDEKEEISKEDIKLESSENPEQEMIGVVMEEMNFNAENHQEGENVNEAMEMVMQSEESDKEPSVIEMIQEPQEQLVVESVNKIEETQESEDKPAMEINQTLEEASEKQDEQAAASETQNDEDSQTKEDEQTANENLEEEPIKSEESEMPAEEEKEETGDATQELIDVVNAPVKEEIPVAQETQVVEEIQNLEDTPALEETSVSKDDERETKLESEKETSFDQKPTADDILSHLPTLLVDDETETKLEVEEEHNAEDDKAEAVNETQEIKENIEIANDEVQAPVMESLIVEEEPQPMEQMKEESEPMETQSFEEAVDESKVSEESQAVEEVQKSEESMNSEDSVAEESNVESLSVAADIVPSEEAEKVEEIHHAEEEIKTSENAEEIQTIADEMEPIAEDVQQQADEEQANKVNTAEEVQQEEVHQAENSMEQVADESKPVEEIQSMEEAQPMEIVQLMENVQPLKVVQLMEDALPMEEGQIIEQTQVVEESHPKEEAHIMEESQLLENAQPMKETQVMEDTQAMKENQPSEETQDMQEAQQMEETQSVEDAQPLKETHVNEVAEETQSDEISQTLEEVQSAEEIQPVEDSEISAEAQTLMEVPAVEESQLMEETQLADEAQTVVQTVPIEQSETVEDSQTVEEVQPMEEAIEEIQSTEDILPIAETQPIKGQAIEEVQEDEIAQPTEEMQNVEETQAIEETHSVEAQAVEEVEKAEDVEEEIQPELVEETQPAKDEAKPVAEIQRDEQDVQEEEEEVKEKEESEVQVEESKTSEASSETQQSEIVEVANETEQTEVKPVEILADEIANEEPNKQEEQPAAQTVVLADEDTLQHVATVEEQQNEKAEEPAVEAVQKPSEDKDSDNILNDDTNESESTSMLTTIVQVPIQEELIQQQVQHHEQVQEQPKPQQQLQQPDVTEIVSSTTVKPLNVLDSVLNYVNASFMPQMNNEGMKQEVKKEEQVVFNSKLRRYDGAQVWRIVVQNDREKRLAEELQTKYDGQLWKEVKQEVDYLLKPQVLAEAERHVRAANLSRIVLIDNLQKVIEVENPPAEEIAQLQNRKGHRLTWQAYHRLEDIHGYFDYMAKTYPDICTVETIGYSIEKRPLKILKISNGNANNPGIWIDGGMHAREWISPAVVTYIANQLVEGWDDLPAYMRNVNWYIHAVANPDGYEYSHTTDRLWRKNMRSHGRVCPGVDLNRNFGYKWGGKGTSANPCAQTYRGSKAFSEPETFYISKFISNFPRETFKAYLSFHSYGQYILYPWGYDYHITKDMADLDLVARQAGTIITKSTGAKYTVGSSANTLYPAAGGSDDWAKGIAGIKYSYTIEMGDTGRYGFVLPADHIEPNGQNGFTFVDTIAKTITMGKNARRRKLKAHKTH